MKSRGSEISERREGETENAPVKKGGGLDIWREYSRRNYRPRRPQGLRNYTGNHNINFYILLIPLRTCKIYAIPFLFSSCRFAGEFFPFLSFFPSPSPPPRKGSRFRFASFISGRKIVKWETSYEPVIENVGETCVIIFAVAQRGRDAFSRNVKAADKNFREISAEVVATHLYICLRELITDSGRGNGPCRYP